METAHRVAVVVSSRHVGPVEDVSTERRSHGGAALATLSSLVEDRIRGAAKSGIVDEHAPCGQKPRRNIARAGRDTFREKRETSKTDVEGQCPFSRVTPHYHQTMCRASSYTTSIHNTLLYRMESNINRISVMNLQSMTINLIANLHRIDYLEDNPMNNNPKNFSFTIRQCA